VNPDMFTKKESFFNNSFGKVSSRKGSLFIWTAHTGRKVTEVAFSIENLFFC
jgi:hypothetical protein